MPTYNTSFLIRVTSDQLSKIKSEAEASGLSISQYTRCKLGLERRPRAAKAEAVHQDVQASEVQDV
jgi:hypothetical protein